jgi:MFS family permease
MSSQLIKLLVSSLFPTKISEDYNSIGDVLVGLFQSMSQVGFTTASGFVGKNLESIGRKNSVIIGLIMIGSACFVFGFAAFATNPNIFFWVSFSMRVVTGVGDGFMKVGTFAICNLEFTVDSEKYSGIVQGSQGLGTLIGPIIMAITLPFIGYMGTFYVVGTIILSSAFLLASRLPSRLNTKEGVDKKKI